jgi:hypothetical protein
VSKIAGIPDFVDGDPRSMSATLRVIKQTLDTLAGQRQDDSYGSPAIYVQTTEPIAGRNKFETGDFWVNTATKKLYYYDGFWRITE